MTDDEVSQSGSPDRGNLYHIENRNAAAQRRRGAVRHRARPLDAGGDAG